MREFINDKGLKMIESDSFFWEKIESPALHYNLLFGNFELLYSISFYPQSKTLSFSRSTSESSELLKFLCLDINKAEELLNLFIEAQGNDYFGVLPQYLKNKK